MNKRFGIIQIIGASILVIGLVITLNQFYGRMKAKSTDDNVNNSKDLPAKNTSIALVSYTPTAQLSDATTVTPTIMNSGNKNALYKLNRDEIADLVSRGVINDPKYSAKKINYGDIEYYTKTVPGNIFYKNKYSLREELLFENRCLDFYIDNDV